jgi:hypothetical protein
MGYSVVHDHIELPEAKAEFYIFWMPHDRPENWCRSWHVFMDGLLDTDQISKQQHKSWPEFYELQL